MKLAILLSGGKDSLYASYLARELGYELSCAISVVSKNKESYMFHTPSIEKTKSQTKAIGIPLIIQETKGEKEIELKDLEKAIAKAKKQYKIEGVVTGAIQSVYQATRIQKICDKLNLECFNPLWQKNEEEYLNELLKAKFKTIITAVAAFPFDATYLGREIDKKFIKEVKKLNEKYKIHVAGEGGEFETFVLDCPLFKKPLEVKDKEIEGEANSWHMEIKI